jgi:uncharacterized protein (DUF1684 family)
MRITIKGFEIEGTPDEVAALLRAQESSDIGRAQMRTDEALKSDINAAVIEEDGRFASEKIAYRALRRRPLSAAQRDLFRALLKAYPNWVSSSDLQVATKYSPNQLGGLLGAIGRRLSQTDGYVRNTSIIEWLWNSDESEYAYRLPPSVVEAVRRIDP